MNLKSDKDLETFLSLAGIDVAGRGWRANGRDGVKRLRQQVEDTDCELAVVRKVRKTCVIVTCDLPRKKRKGKKRGKPRTVVYREHKFAPDGTEIPRDGEGFPKEKLRKDEDSRAGGVRLIDEELWIEGVKPSELVRVQQVRVRKPSTHSFPGLPSEVTMDVYWWRMPPRLFEEEIVEQKEDGSMNKFRAYPIPPKLLAKLKALRP